MKRKYEIAVLSKGGFARTVRIYAPKKADRAVIMHDGQNVFSDGEAAYKKSWRAIDILKECGIKNTAVIGIDCTPTRLDDYLPFPNELAEYGISPFGGKVETYTTYLSDIIIPYLDKRFEFEFYGMLGSSAGALATLFYASQNNKRVKAYGIFSAPVYVSPTAFEKFFGEKPFQANSMYRVYAGGNENTGTFRDGAAAADEPQMFVDDAFKVTNALRACGATDIRLCLENTAVHDETSWRQPERSFFRDFAALTL